MSKRRRSPVAHFTALLPTSGLWQSVLRRVGPAAGRARPRWRHSPDSRQQCRLSGLLNQAGPGRGDSAVVDTFDPKEPLCRLARRRHRNRARFCIRLWRLSLNLHICRARLHHAPGERTGSRRGLIQAEGPNAANGFLYCLSSWSRSCFRAVRRPCSLPLRGSGMDLDLSVDDGEVPVDRVKEFRDPG
jgi:hypothetical protein